MCLPQPVGSRSDGLQIIDASRVHPTVRRQCASGSLMARGARRRRFSRRARSGAPIWPRSSLLFFRSASFAILLPMLGRKLSAALISSFAGQEGLGEILGWRRQGTAFGWHPSVRDLGAEKSSFARAAAFRAPAALVAMRVLTSSISPGARSPSLNGPKETQINRLTARPRWASTFLTSRFFPSLMRECQPDIVPCMRSTVASIGP